MKTPLKAYLTAQNALTGLCLGFGLAALLEPSWPRVAALAVAASLHGWLTPRALPPVVAEELRQLRALVARVANKVGLT
jgi:hypothetical protein